MTAPPVWVGELAAHFWALAGDPPPPPRDLEGAITGATPLSVVERPGLSPSAVAAFLARQGVPAPAPSPERPLSGALYCWRGAGFVFVDAADPPEERRFSLAHELAHYLADYDAGRRRAVRAFGPAALEVLDGARPASPDERLHAVLRRRALAPHVHLMARDPDGRTSAGEREAEERADRLALELLAPASLLPPAGRAETAARLVGGFGLPESAAGRYAVLLCPAGRSAGAGYAGLVNLSVPASNSRPVGGTNG